MTALRVSDLATAEEKPASQTPCAMRALVRPRSEMRSNTLALCELNVERKQVGKGSGGRKSMSTHALYKSIAFFHESNYICILFYGYKLVQSDQIPGYKIYHRQSLRLAKRRSNQCI